MEILTTIGDFIWGFIEIVTDTITQVLNFLNSFSTFIFSYLDFLPNEIFSMLSVVIIFIIGVFIYRFLR